MMLDMENILMGLLLLCSSGLGAEVIQNDESVRLVGGSSRCSGTVEVKRGEWRPLFDPIADLTLRQIDVICRKLDCGSAVSMQKSSESSDRSVWGFHLDCELSESDLKDCVAPASSPHSWEVTCSESVRLVKGHTVCSGRLEVKSDQSNQSWSSVCEDDFDQQDAEVVCRELGCGAPSDLQGALYGEGEAPMWTKEFQCGGQESALLDCGRSDSARNTCSPGRAVGLTCSEPARLVGGSSRCSGTLEMKYQNEWRPVFDRWRMLDLEILCLQLYCGPHVSREKTEESLERPVWGIGIMCFQPDMKDCITHMSSTFSTVITCLDVPIQPNISVSSLVDGVSEAQQQGFQVTRGSDFTVSCSIQPHFPLGSFVLAVTSSNSAQNHTQLAVNHSANFLFPAAEPAHQGNYSCVYHALVSTHQFSSESRQLSLTVSE